MNPDETAVEKDFVSPRPGSFQRLFLFSFCLDTFSLPLAPEVGHHGLHTAEETQKCLDLLPCGSCPPSWLRLFLLMHHRVSSAQCLLDACCSLCPGGGGWGGGAGRIGGEGPSFAQKTHQTPSHQTGAPAFKESLKIRPGQARRSASWG